jgi:hypothetical protein
MFKSVIVASLLVAHSVYGFAPSASTRANVVGPLAATAELEGLIGVDIESGNKIVSFVFYILNLK